MCVTCAGCGGLSAATSQVPDAPTLDNSQDSDKPVSMLVMSGGEGYIDFRIGKYPPRHPRLLRLRNLLILKLAHTTNLL